MHQSEVEKWADKYGLQRQRIFFLVSGPSGSGKTELLRRVARTTSGLKKLVTTTSRPMRAGEKHGRGYYFVSRQDFERMVAKGELVEWKEILGNYYGLSWEELRGHFENDVIFDMDVAGKRDFEKAASVDCVTIFLYPPSLAILEERLKARGHIAEEELKKRMQRGASELSHIGEYRYAVENKDLERATQQIKAIIIAERSNRDMRLFEQVYPRLVEEIVKNQDHG